MPQRKVTTGPTTAIENVLKVFTRSTGEIQVKLTNGNPKTTSGIMSALPFESKIQTWGDEIYFKVPAKAPEENTKTVVEVGDVAYWPPGESMCIFFGPTPASEANEPRAYSPVNVFGKVIGDSESSRKLKMERI